MAYGHAERNLATIRLLEASTEELFGSLEQAEWGQSRWSEQSAGVSSQWPGALAPGVPGHVHDHGVRKGTVIAHGDVARRVELPS